MLDKKLAFKLANELLNHKEAKEIRSKKHKKKDNQKQQKIELFGKVRYYLAYWFGEWILYI